MKPIAFAKLSKKQRQEMDRSRRGTWGVMSPVTRKPNPSGAYDRKKNRWQREVDRLPNTCGFIFNHLFCAVAFLAHRARRTM